MPAIRTAPTQSGHGSIVVSRVQAEAERFPKGKRQERVDLGVRQRVTVQGVRRSVVIAQPAAAPRNDRTPFVDDHGGDRERSLPVAPPG